MTEKELKQIKLEKSMKPDKEMEAWQWKEKKFSRRLEMNLKN